MKKLSNDFWEKEKSNCPWNYEGMCLAQKLKCDINHCAVYFFIKALLNTNKKGDK